MADNSIQQLTTLPQQNEVKTTPTQRLRCVIWEGCLEWIDEGYSEGQKILRKALCQVASNYLTGEVPEVKGDGWSQKLFMDLLPKEIVARLCDEYIHDVKTLLFMVQNCDDRTSLTRSLESDFVGCLHLNGTSMQANCEIKALLLIFNKELNAFIGFVPKNQDKFVDRIMFVIEYQEEQSRKKNNKVTLPEMDLSKWL